MSKQVEQNPTDTTATGKGLTIEILYGSRTCPRYAEIKKWLRANKPDSSIAEYSIGSEPGKEKWFTANKHFGKTSLPQVILVHKKARMHFSDVDELEKFFPKEKLPKEVGEQLV